LTELVDDKFDDLDGVGTCAVPQSIPVGGSYQCEFTKFISGEAGDSHVNVVTATATNQAGTEEDSDSEDALIVFQRGIELTKQVSPGALPASGGEVTYEVRVENTGGVEVKLTQLVDDKFDDLDGVGTCAVPQSIPVGGSYQCEFTKFISGEAGTSHVNVVTGFGIDEGGAPVIDAGAATVLFTQAPAVIDVSLSADAQVVPESGRNVTYTVIVTNVGSKVVFLSELRDRFGDLNGRGECSVPQVISVGEDYECDFTETISGDAGEDHVNVVTAVGMGPDGTRADGADDAQVQFSDDLPGVSVAMSVEPTLLPDLPHNTDPHRPRLPGSGGKVTYMVTVANEGLEQLRLEDVFGNLNGVESCSAPPLIPVGGSNKCKFTESISGEAGTPHVIEVTATGSDDDGNTASDTGKAPVEFYRIFAALTDNEVDGREITCGNTYEYTAKLYNLGTEAIEVDLQLELPESLTAVDATEASRVLRSMTLPHGELVEEAWTIKVEVINGAGRPVLAKLSVTVGSETFEVEEPTVVSAADCDGTSDEAGPGTAPTAGGLLGILAVVPVEPSAAGIRRARRTGRRPPYAHRGRAFMSHGPDRPDPSGS
ncbi:MAG: hypothetical protein O6951_09840, partial [Actinobacteria bacterium]|nr:hypothetical protein [Actinomycetota bacterium]